MCKYTIYKITNLINNKSYIGITIRNIDYRWREHCKPSRKKVSILTNAIIKYGKNNFELEILEKDIDDKNKENYYITLYNTLSPNGYNLTTGGEHFQITEQERKRRSEFLKGKRLLLGKKQNKEWIEKRIKNKRKPFIGIHIKTKEIVEFNSLNEASKFFNKKYVQSINDCCNGKQKSAYGYIWNFKKNI